MDRFFSVVQSMKSFTFALRLFPSLYQEAVQVVADIKSIVRRNNSSVALCGLVFLLLSFLVCYNRMI